MPDVEQLNPRADVIRSQLTNAPLATKDHLIAVSDVATGSLLMIGRDTEAFEQADLRAAHELMREASPLIGEALAITSLARSLDRFRDLR